MNVSYKFDRSNKFNIKSTVELEIFFIKTQRIGFFNERLDASLFRGSLLLVKISSLGYFTHKEWWLIISVKLILGFVPLHLADE